MAIKILIISIIFLGLFVVSFIMYYKQRKFNNFLTVKEFTKSLLGKPLFFINMRVKKDGVLYYVDAGIVTKLDNKLFKWVILKCKQLDNTYKNIKFSTAILFLTLQEANSFLNGEWSLSELNELDDSYFEENYKEN